MIARPYDMLPAMKRYMLLRILIFISALAVPPTGLSAASVKHPVKQPVKQPVKVTPKKIEPVVVVTEPPEIIISTSPAILVTIDGPPEYTLVKGAAPLLWRVVNTKVLLLKNANGKHYLHLYDGFLEAESLNEPWSVTAKVPMGVKLAEIAARTAKTINLLEGTPDPKTKKKPSLKKTITPWVYLSMMPAELLVIDGEPDFISIEETRLFHARNTTGDLFWLQGDGTMYLLASGFWFRAESYLGPWEIVPDDGLPQDFRDIPDSSVKRKVKASVPPPKAPIREIQGPVSGSAWLEDLLTRHASPLREELFHRH